MPQTFLRIERLCRIEMWTNEGRRSSVAHRLPAIHRLDLPENATALNCLCLWQIPLLPVTVHAKFLHQFECESKAAPALARIPRVVRQLIPKGEEAQCLNGCEGGRLKNVI